MHLGSTLTPRDSPPNDEANDTKIQAYDPVRGKGANSNGDGSNVWRRKASVPTQGSTPFAQVEEMSSSDPAARITDLNKMQSSTNTPRHPMDHNQAPNDEGATQQQDPRKIIVNVPAALLANLRTQCNTKASVSLLGRIQGKHPGLQALTAWAHENLHPSLDLLSLKANNIFEVTFEQPEGRIHALNQADLMCESAAIYFSSWRPHFDATTPQDTEKLDHPVWLQIVNLCQVLRDETFLHIIGEQIGQVISIDNSEAYRAKLFGPRIRLLVRDLDTLPHTVILPRLDGEGTIEYALEFSGLPNQCGRCRSREHQVRFCPKKETVGRYKPVQRFHNRKTELAPRARTYTIPTYAPEPQLTTQEASQVEPEKQTEEQTTQREQAPPKETSDEPQPAPQSPQAHITPAQEGDTPISKTPLITTETADTDAISNKALEPTELNFPKLPSPAHKEDTGTQEQRPASPSVSTAFVWRTPPKQTEQDTTRKGKEKGKGKQINRTPESTPLTRQGYRSGRLADDFWTALRIPLTPTSPRKTIRVIPLIIKEGTKEETMEYLVNTKPNTHKAIAQVHIAELLAGVPWTENRAQQHMVSEVAQALYKIFIFTNPAQNPLQWWNKGQWFAHWEKEHEGAHVCTIYVSVIAKANKMRPRRGQTLDWHNVPAEVQTRIQNHSSETIEAIEDDGHHWYKLIH